MWMQGEEKAVETQESVAAAVAKLVAIATNVTADNIYFLHRL